MDSGDGTIRVAVMGATGSGKSTFINLASGSNLAVSDSLESCTIDVETATFFLDGRNVMLIDTPGFDDTVRSDTDILKSITDHLASSYSQGAKLAGVIYMHRISDNKMGGPSRRNFHILRKLIGDAGLQNVLLVTNMWSKVDPEEGKARERELATKEKFFKPALEMGAQMLRHDGSRGSAHAILRGLVGREPSTLLVQTEMVDQAKDLAHTTVGADLMNMLKEQSERHAALLDDLCEGIEAARVEEDEKTRELLQEEARKARDKIERIQANMARMVANLATENAQLKNENRWYKQKARGEGSGRGESGPTAEHELLQREKREGERQEHHERERRERRKQEEEKLENERKEREKQERERQEYRKKQRELQEAAERAKEERIRQERERLEKEKSSGSSCVIQ